MEKMVVRKIIHKKIALFRLLKTRNPRFKSWVLTFEDMFRTSTVCPQIDFNTGKNFLFLISQKISLLLIVFTCPKHKLLFI